MNERQERFIELLRQIFELDKADLDFGIYRILNFRHREIEEFFTTRLPQKITETLQPFAAGNKETIRQRMNEIERQLGNQLETLPESIPLVAEYKQLKQQLQHGTDLSALESDVYIALYSFFSRYYDEGDFISKRRYKEGVYAIPYEGEEVKLYWANQDQYYIKTSENFKDYTFMTDGYNIHFRLVDATTEQNNNKESDDKKRKFMLFTENEEQYPGVRTFEVEGKDVSIRFLYDVPEDTKVKYEETNLAAINEWINNQPDVDLRVALLRNANPDAKTDKRKTIIQKHLEAYVAKNSFDYFIHKDLGGFLSRELDFFIKNEVMHLDDLDTESEARVGSYLAKVRAIKRVGKDIITFLAQIENFQKRLWLKKKFVVETNWCITLDRVPEKYYDEIRKNKAQVEEWKELYSIHEIELDLEHTEPFTEEPTLLFLEQNKNLIVDTKHFTEEFKQRLVGEIDKLDEATGGLMMNSDNYQALGLINAKYSKAITCVYIDPPYNTDATPILYKNGYKDSSWLTLIHDRMYRTKDLLDPNIGYWSVAIDDMELHNLYKVMQQELIGMDVFQVIVNHYPGSGTGRSNVSKTHEYNLFAVPKNTDILRGKVKPGGERIRGFCRSGTGDNNYRYGRPNSFYAVLVNDKHEIVGFEAPPSLSERYPTNPTQEGYIRIYPLGGNGVERCWSLGYDSAEKYWKAGMLECTPNNIIRRKYYDGASRELCPSLWVDKKYSAVVYGTNLLTKMFGESERFSFPKSLYTVSTAIEAGTFDEPDCIVLDYFGGSGTTGHAVMTLNEVDGGNRRFILIEMGNYFNTVTLARVKKAAYSLDWDKGKPLSRRGKNCSILKYIRLEQYEDALNNIALPEEPNTRMQSLFGDDYTLQYMLDIESRDSLLNVNAFTTPFEYEMRITEKNETKARKVDVCETFNYLIGLNVIRQGAIQRYQTSEARHPEYEGAVDLVIDREGVYQFRQIEGTLRDGKRVLVIWRNITDDLLASNAALDAYFTKYRINPLNRDYDIIYVNGDSNIENLRTDDEHWKVVRTEAEFNKRMFEDC